MPRPLTHRGRRPIAICLLLGILAALASLAGCASGLPSSAQVFVVSPDGGDLEQLTDDGVSYDGVSWSPDGRALVTAGGDPNRGFIRRVDAMTGEVEELARFDSAPVPSVVWSPTGEWLAGARQSLEGRPQQVIFLMRPDGSQPRTVERFQEPRSGGFGPSWSGDGRWLAFVAGGPAADRLVIARSDGTEPRPVEIGARPGEHILHPLLSPDGSRVLATVGASSRPFLRLVVADRAGGRFRALVRGLITAEAEWSPDGEAIVFSGVTEEGDRRYHLFTVPADGGELRRLADERPAARHPRHSPDGSRLAYADERGDLRVRELASGRTTTVADLDDGEIFGIAWAPDGSRIAFTARQRPRSD